MSFKTKIFKIKVERVGCKQLTLTARALFLLYVAAQCIRMTSLSDTLIICRFV